MWIILGIFSAAFLGFHEIFKKTALNHNAVLPVLFMGSATSALVFIPILIISRISPDFSQYSGLHIPESPPDGHLFFLLKSAIVFLVDDNEARIP